MENIRKRLTKGYILLESLLALALLAVLTTIMLSELGQAQAETAHYKRQIELLNVAQMALDTGQSELNLNGVTVKLTKSDKTLIITNAETGEKELELEILQVQK